jgi:hypothetical protein
MMLFVTVTITICTSADTAPYRERIAEKQLKNIQYALGWKGRRGSGGKEG